MPDPRPLTGLFGKVPAHGDFVRRGLPSSFVTPWDAWLQAAVAAARGQLGDGWEAAWDSAPAWRFALPAGACGPDAVAGVMLPSQDQVGRRFPITLAALLAGDGRIPGADWFDAVEAAALAGRDGRADADALAAAIPPPDGPVIVSAFALPAVAATAAAALPADPSWAAAAPLSDDGPPPLAADVDVLAMLGAGATEGAPRSALPGDDALALLLGGADAPPAPEPMPPDGTLAGLIGAAPGESRLPAGPEILADPAADPDATLAALIGAAPGDPPGLPGPGRAGDAGSGDADAVLAALIGSAAAVPSREPYAPPPGGAMDGDGVLAGLIGAAGAGPGADAPEPSDAVMALSGAAELPGEIDSADLLPETVAPAWPELQDAAAAGPPAAAPEAPEGGGWWTRGGAHVPPMVWPFAALPASSDFAYLLESAA